MLYIALYLVIVIFSFAAFASFIDPHKRTSWGEWISALIAAFIWPMTWGIIIIMIFKKGAHREN